MGPVANPSIKNRLQHQELEALKVLKDVTAHLSSNLDLAVADLVSV